MVFAILLYNVYGTIKFFFVLKSYQNFILSANNNTRKLRAWSKEKFNKFNPRIHNGTKISINNAPFQAQLTDMAGNWEGCGAALISLEFGLTAAHCIEVGKYYRLRLGSSKINSGGRLVYLWSLYVHPQWD